LSAKGRRIHSGKEDDNSEIGFPVLIGLQKSPPAQSQEGFSIQSAESVESLRPQLDDFRTALADLEELKPDLQAIEVSV
jgi:hypothetical protein